MPKVHFDIGANDGSTMRDRAKDPNNIVYFFEPNPEFAGSLNLSQPNVIYIPKAVSNYNGKAMFNVCDQCDRGCSSLLTVSEKGKTKWGGRKDMIPVKQIEVDVIRLDSLDWSVIPEVEWLHCDAQGSDLAVLEGLGEYISRVKGGVVEAAKEEDILYEGQNTSAATEAFLRANGFKDIRIWNNDPAGNEVNIEFKR